MWEILKKKKKTGMFLYCASAPVAWLAMHWRAMADLFFMLWRF